MFRRIFWLSVGITVGVLGWRKLQQIIRAYGPQGLTERAQAGAAETIAGLQAFAGTVRQLAAEREAELRAELAAHQPALAAQRPSAARSTRSSRHRGDGRELRGIPRVSKSAKNKAVDARPANRHGD